MLQFSQTRQELLNNTVNHFNSNNRAVTSLGGCVFRDKRCVFRDKRCVFRDKQGRGCAIGRELDDDLAKELDVSPAVAPYERYPERLQNLGRAFLIRIQNLHDNSDHWNEKGLSDQGRGEVIEICKAYDLQIPEKAK